jgi:hypothetical protein
VRPVLCTNPAVSRRRGMVGDRRRPWSCSQAIVCGVSGRFPRAGVQHVAARMPWLQVQRPYPVLGPGCSLAGQGHLTQQLLCGGSTTKATVTGLARSLEQQRSRYVWARSRLACHVQKRHGALSGPRHSRLHYTRGSWNGPAFWKETDGQKVAFVR